MDLTLTREQEQMRESLRDFFDARGGIDIARRYVDGEGTSDGGEDVLDGLWSDLAEMGYTGLTVPPKFDGFGEDLVYLVLVLEEAGRVAMPGPYPETTAFVAPLLAEAGSETQRAEFLPAIAAGDHRSTFAVHDDGSERDPTDVGLAAERVGGGHRLSGTKTLVPYGDAVDSVVVATRTAHDGNEGITLFLVERGDADVEQLDGIDGTRPLARVRFDDVVLGEEARLGPLHGGGPLLDRAVDRYTVSTCAMLVGAADRTVSRSVDHATTRHQFGHPIGRFQAVKHRIADMWMRTRAGRSLVYYAAWSVANGGEDARKAVSSAKSYVSTSCVDVFEADIQNHGATGFTWDHPTHIFLRQARAWENLLGDRRYHRDRVADERGI